jgi:photosystem II stability/assembly factor-like uncharacterized protein
MKIQRNSIRWFPGIFIIFLTMCAKNNDKYTPAPPPDRISPKVITGEVSDIADSSATCVGTVVIGGSSELSSIGACWDTVPEPVVTWNSYITTPTIGTYTIKLGGLRPDKKYYVRTYATSSDGIFYGNEVSFVTHAGWSKITSSILNAYTINSMESKGASIYLGTQNGVLFSPDTGNTWQHIGLAGKEISSITINDATLFAGCSPNVYRSTDNGNSWTTSNPLPGVSYQYQISKLVFNGSSIFLTATYYVYVSSNNGVTWTKTSNGLTGIAGYLTGIASSGPNVMISTDMSHVYVTNNGGGSWTESSSMIMTGQQCLGLTPIGNKIYLNQNGSEGYYSADDGSTWQAANDLPVFPAMLYSSGSTVFLFGYVNNSSRFLISYNGGTTWSIISAMGYTDYSVRSMTIAGDYFFAASQSLGLFKRRRL